MAVSSLQGQVAASKRRRQSIAELRSLYEGKCSEVEALKQRVAMLEENEARRAEPKAPTQRRTLMEISKLIAIKFRCTTRINAGVVEYFKSGTRSWVAVPTKAIDEVVA